MTVDGSDVLACYAAARDAVARARAGDGPTLIEAKVTRLTAHSRTTSRRSTAPRRRWTRRRRSTRAEVPEQLVDAGILTTEAEERSPPSIKDAVDDATEYAEAQPDPTPSTAMKWVYAEDWPSETPPPWGIGKRRGTPPATRPSRLMAAEDVHRGGPRRRSPRRWPATRRVIVLGEDVGKKGGVFLATDGLWASSATTA